MTEHSDIDPAITEMWRHTLVEGHEDKPSSYLPGSHRCSFCLVPMSGVSGVIMKALRNRTPSRKNPEMCNY
ncbi:MAG: hypothetical protein HOJ22_01190 [Chloroflexi bacterium]|jgi:hypothetical protein|nr:hypothetical protein [Chloroflexota bacterium]MBT5626882.1 hypothetical protein [Chloroflexota bacterium]